MEGNTNDDNLGNTHLQRPSERTRKEAKKKCGGGEEESWKEHRKRCRNSGLKWREFPDGRIQLCQRHGQSKKNKEQKVLKRGPAGRNRRLRRQTTFSPEAWLPGGTGEHPCAGDAGDAKCRSIPG